MESIVRYCRNCHLSIEPYLLDDPSNAKGYCSHLCEKLYDEERQDALRRAGDYA